MAGREPKPEWLAALRQLCGGESDLRFNYTVGRWEFVLPSADGVLRSQFWGWFYRQNVDGTRTPLPIDPETGLHAFRDLDDAAMAEALDNLERTFVGNPFDGAGSTRKEIERRIAWNEQHKRAGYVRAATLFEDMVRERRGRLLGYGFSAGGIDKQTKPKKAKPKIEIVSTLGSKA